MLDHVPLPTAPRPSCHDPDRRAPGPAIADWSWEKSAAAGLAQEHEAPEETSKISSIFNGLYEIS
jgi:hypothetical protein